ncbi:hypothetical protein GCM10009639_41170 [Kitasatospora putterlickiae]|uniref:Uncharacterized protein n=1 Tax=Kitasatospora putterlickiae TaxID=221725 RepID=A0ABP4J0L5_9ACTN
MEHLGPLVHVCDGPDGLAVWGVAEPERWGAGVNVMVEAGQDVGAVDLGLLGEVLARLEEVVAAGRRFVCAESGVTEEEAALDSPEVNVYVDGWMLRFAQGGLPMCEPFGVGVWFEGLRPVRVEDLGEAEEIGY